MTYVNPASVLGISIFFPILGAIAVIARFIVRRKREISLGLDDWLCIPAWVLVTGCAASLIVGVAGKAIGYRSGPKDNAGNNPKIIFIEKCEFAFLIMSPLALGCIKLSILFFYRRIFRGRLFSIMNWTLIVLVILWTLAFTLVQILDCKTHVEINWGLLTDLQKCINTLNELLALSISDVIIDVSILVLPIPHVWMLHMPTRRKVVVTGIFFLGLIAVIAGILRLVIFAELFGAGHTQKVLVVLGVKILDDMSVVSLFLFWPMIEMGIALVVACLPTLRPVFHGMSPESVIQSIRSKLSLPSLHGSESGRHSHEESNQSRKTSFTGSKKTESHDNTGHELVPIEDLQGSGTRMNEYDSRKLNGLLV